MYIPEGKKKKTTPKPANPTKIKTKPKPKPKQQIRNKPLSEIFKVTYLAFQLYCYFQTRLNITCVWTLLCFTRFFNRCGCIPQPANPTLYPCSVCTTDMKVAGRYLH